MRHSCVSSCFRYLSCLRRLVCGLNPVWIHIFYFLSVSLLGFCVLKVLKPRTEGDFKPRNLDMFFTSVSAATVSSMSTVEMEICSNSQLIVLTIMMFIGGEVFTSMAGLFMSNSKPKLPRAVENVASLRPNSCSNPENITNTGTESGVLINNPKPENLQAGEVADHNQSETFMYHSIKFLSFVVLGYLLVINLLGIALVSLYLSFVSRARRILRSKGLKLFTFSLFTTVSTFTNCGFVPTNENMVVFRQNSGLFLILIPQILQGNTLFPACLRFSLWVLGKVVKRVEYYSNYLLKNTGEIGYPHLLSSRQTWCLVATVLGFIVVQLGLFCAMEWNSEGLIGMNTVEKMIGLLFQCVNTRHTGETIVDLSTISAAILVLLIVMMSVSLSPSLSLSLTSLAIA
ncbi:hypothetical protein DITRI_Ditri12bG0107400 [Diplodiscus trichospermus]